MVFARERIDESVLTQHLIAQPFKPTTTQNI
jgi:hypothetical protein